jgi:hypothetical protein
MTIMTVFKLFPNIVLNRVFQCEKQFCLDFCILFCRFSGIHYFLGFRSIIHWVWAWSKTSCLGFCRCFSCSLFFAGPFLCASFVVLYAWWESRGVVRLADCGSRWDTFMRCMVVYVGCRGLSDLFVLLPPSPSFVFCCWLVCRVLCGVVGGAVTGVWRQGGAVV